jgi:hypothetical protein
LLHAFRAAAVAWLFLSSSSGSTHHSGAVYDTDVLLTLRGTVSRYEWRNPHVYVFVEVEDDTGQLFEWALEAESTALLTRAGWSPTTLAPGDRISARVNRNRDPARFEARIRTLSAPDGTILGRRVRGTAAPTVAASSLAGVWDALRDYENFEFARGEVTAHGTAALSAFDEARSPVQDCVAFAAPIVTFLPYRSEIEIADDRVYIRSEFFSIERVVFMDGRGHPENGERTPQGHSIGHWEDDVLVVDTALFSDNPIGNFRGLPSGAHKHVVERFNLSEDRTRIRVEFWAEDPEYLAEPWTGEIVWDHVPDGEILPFECDPEVSRRFAIQ